MKVLTVLGTRPEIIRLSRVIALLDRACDHFLVHTGQNYERCLSELFISELRVREPNLYLGIRGAYFGEQAGHLFSRIEPVLLQEQPDRLLILGDTNSGLSAVIARRLGIPVYHMEAGNRCFDDRVPEEVNRRIIDHCSSVLMPYTHRSKENLVREGIPEQRIFVTGNPIKEVMSHYAAEVGASAVLDRLHLEKNKYFLVTMHRAENVDYEDRLRQLVDALTQLHARYGYPVVCSLHPRTRAKVEKFALDMDRPGLHFLEPFGFFDFVALERSAYCILSDSGTVQEEACILKVPNVTIRDVTERPETIECGSNVLSGCSPDSILSLVQMITGEQAVWDAPAEYLVDHVASTVCKIVLGYRVPDSAEVIWQRRSSPPDDARG